ncbi:MAG TPA: hypothetical protein VI814_00715 [Candidatus Limnocylindria bacterium]
MRVRNLVVIVLPAAAIAIVALALQSWVDARVGEAAFLLAMLPAPLVAPDVVRWLRGRDDLAGALVLGSAVVWVALAAVRGDLASGRAMGPLEVFVIASMAANVVPRARDRLLGVIVWTQRLAAVVLVGAGLVAAHVDPAAFGGAVALFVAGIAAASLAALATGRELRAAVWGAGLRDPALAAAVGWSLSSAALTLALAYAALCIVAAAVFASRR